MLLRANVARSNPEPPAPVSVAIAPVLELTPPTAARAAAPTAHAAAAAPPPAKPAPAVAVSKPASNNTKANASKPAVAAPVAPASARPAASAAVPVAKPAPASEPDQSLSPQAIDDILEFELVPDIGAASASTEEEVPMSPASSFQQDSLAWTTSGLGLSTDDPVPAAPPVLGPAKPAAAPARAAAPAKAAASSAPTAPLPVAQVAPPVAPVALAIPVAQVASVAAAPPVLQAPVAAPTLAAIPAPGAAADPMASIGIDLLLPAALGGSNPTSAPAVAAAVKSAAATSTAKALGNTGTARALNGSATSNVQALNATGTSRSIALDPSSIILDVQPFSKLRAGGRMRRYEVLPRMPHRDANRAPSAMDGLALQRLLSWLGSNRSAWNLEPTSFSLNLSISTLEDERFPQQVASSLKANGIAPDNLGFEIAEPLCTQRRAQVERFISLCDKLGCFVVIDDFSFDSSVLPLLRSKALRLVKIDPKLTSAALRDKLSQAVVVAIVQAVKVLGIHCAAKRVESQASLQWLTAIGCDLAQGPALSQVLPIESLNMAQTAAPATDPPKAG
jgi:EAL domain-containing protein (putative c-di-GMP-specific phosphodiesterase class I)